MLLLALRRYLLRKAGPGSFVPQVAGARGMAARAATAPKAPKVKPPSTAGKWEKKALKVYYTPEQIKALGLVWRTLDVPGHPEGVPILVKDLGTGEGIIVGGATNAFNWTRVSLGEKTKRVRPRVERKELTPEEEAETLRKLQEAYQEQRKKIAELAQTIQEQLGAQLAREGVDKLTREEEQAIIRRALKRAEKLRVSEEAKEEFVRTAIEEARTQKAREIENAANRVAEKSLELVAAVEATGDRGLTAEVAVADEKRKRRVFRLTSDNALEIAKKVLEVRVVRSQTRALERALRAGDPKAAEAVELALRPLSDEEVARAALAQRVELEQATLNAKLIDAARLGTRTSDRQLRLGAVNTGAALGLMLAQKAVLPARTAGVLGTVGAARIIAWHIAQTTGDADKALRQVRGLIATKGAATAATALQEAQAYLATAERMRQYGRGKNAIITPMQANRYAQNMLDRAAEVASRAIGGLETMAQVALALEAYRRGTPDSVLVPGRSTEVGTEEMAQSATTGLGLAKEDYAIEKRGGRYYIRIKESGLRKLIEPMTEEEWERDRENAELKELGAVAEASDWAPKGFNPAFKLMRHQEAGIKFWAKNKRVLVGDEVGTGKTVVALGGIAHLFSEGKVKRALVVVPTSVFAQIQDEVEKFLGEEWRNATIAVTDREKAKLAHNPATGNRITIVTHDALRTQEHLIAQGQYDAIVVDEAHIFAERGAGGQAGRKRAFQRLMRSAEGPKYALLMSGTLIKNELDELYSLVDTLRPGYLGTRADFMRRYGRLYERTGLIDDVLLAQLRHKLDDVLIGFRISRRKEEEEGREVIELKPLGGGAPIKAEIEEINVELSEAQVREYRAIEEEYLRKKRQGAPQRELMSILARRERIVSGLPGQVPLPAPTEDARAADGSVGYEPEACAKYRVAMEHIPRLLQEGRRVLIFATHEYALAPFKAGLAEHGYKFEVIDGSTPSHKRKQIAESLKRPDGPDIVLCTDAVNFGLNMTGATAEIHTELPPTAACLQQRIGRIFRRGQSRDVKVLNLYSKTPLEEKLRLLLRAKQRMLDIQDAAMLYDEKGLADKLVEVLAAAGEAPEVSLEVPQ